MTFGGICSWGKQQALPADQIYLKGKAEIPRKNEWKVCSVVLGPMEHGILEAQHRTKEVLL